MSAYRGRFAPSPTGPLHFGSLIAALGSYLQARSVGGTWLVRMEDVDVPRNVPGADREILCALEHFGLNWDGAVLYQSQRIDAYRESIDALLTRAMAFACACTRRETGGRPYPGTCRDGIVAGRSARSVRVRVDDCPVRVQDAVQGTCMQDLHSEYGDFVVLRGDGMVAYHLAVVVDDAYQGITEIVRGADLLGCTPSQVFLQRALGLPLPAYAHLPVATNRRGQKLSKQTHAAPVAVGHPVPSLHRALAFLGQRPPPALLDAECNEVLDWAKSHWDLDRVPRLPSVTETDGGTCVAGTG